jgi:hypothetical protein
LRGLGRRRFGWGRMPGMGGSDEVMLRESRSGRCGGLGWEAVRIMVGGCIIGGGGIFGDGIRGDCPNCGGGLEDDGFRLN